MLLLSRNIGNTILIGDFASFTLHATTEDSCYIWLNQKNKEQKQVEMCWGMEMEIIDGITLCAWRNSGTQVRFGIQAPKSIVILRKEIAGKANKKVNKEHCNV